MTVLNDETRKIFDAAIERMKAHEKAYKDSQLDAKRIAPEVVGKRALVRDTLYEITEISGSFDGTLRARGYKIIASGKRGSQVWDIGFVCARHFDDATT